MKKIISLLMALLLTAMLLCGCGSDTQTKKSADGEANSGAEMTDEKIKNEIVGAWVAEIDGSEQGYIFLEDGTGYAAILPLTYTVEDGMLNMTIEAFGQVETLSAEYNVSGDTLILEKDGKAVELKRTEMPEEFKDKQPG